MPFKKGQIPWNKKPWIKKVCLHCKKHFEVKPSHFNRKYCSQKCFWNDFLPHRIVWNKGLTTENPKVKEWHEKCTKTTKRLYAEGKLIPPMQNKKHTKKSKTKMQKSQLERWAKIDKISAQERKNRQNARIGTHQSVSTKKKMRESRLKYWDKVGRKEWGDVRVITSKDVEWRTKIFLKNVYKCQNCGTSINLNAHHIFNYRKYPKLRYKINNGITLCKPCHKSFHHIYGNKNNTKKQLNEFLNYGY